MCGEWRDGALRFNFGRVAERACWRGCRGDVALIPRGRGGGVWRREPDTGHRLCGQSASLNLLFPGGSCDMDSSRRCFRSFSNRPRTIWEISSPLRWSALDIPAFMPWMQVDHDFCGFCWHWTGCFWVAEDFHAVFAVATENPVRWADLDLIFAFVCY